MSYSQFDIAHIAFRVCIHHTETGSRINESYTSATNDWHADMDKRHRLEAPEKKNSTKKTKDRGMNKKFKKITHAASQTIYARRNASGMYMYIYLFCHEWKKKGYEIYSEEAERRGEPLCAVVRRL